MGLFECVYLVISIFRFEKGHPTTTPYSTYLTI